MVAETVYWSKRVKTIGLECGWTMQTAHQKNEAPTCTMKLYVVRDNSDWVKTDDIWRSRPGLQQFLLTQYTYRISLQLFQLKTRLLPYVPKCGSRIRQYQLTVHFNSDLTATQQSNMCSFCKFLAPNIITLPHYQIYWQNLSAVKIWLNKHDCN